MKYHIIVFGCQFNKSDAEKISQLLNKKGYKLSPAPNKADLVVVLMCSVRQKSVDKIKNKILNIKNINKKAKIVVTGCVLASDKQWFKNQGVEIKTFKDLEKFPPLSGLITIGKGCNNFCSYCVVPYTRGKEIYRKEKEILNEIKELIAKKYNHITLLGENVNSYPDFVELLKKITAIKGDFKVNFMAANPHNFSDELIAEIAQNPKLEKYLHLPLQSGDNAILKKMKRPYTAQKYLKLIAKIKKQIPNVKIVTDIIVGFPGETKKQFQNTVNVFKKACFYQAYISKYSPRPGTAAFFLKDTVPAEEKSRREQELRKILNDSKKK